MILAQAFMAKRKEDDAEEQESEEKKTISLRLSEPRYYTLLKRHSKKARRKPSDFVRVSVEERLDELEGEEN
jgi:hypothetical protein